MGGELIVLGCGASAGVPAIGNWWGACDPEEPRNTRTRPSIALKTETTLAIIDTGPDFREQMNREKLGCPDAVIITHEHSDHINGIDELRTLQRLHKGRKFPIYAYESCLSVLERRFDYMFNSSEDGFYPAVCEAFYTDRNSDIEIGDLTLQTFVQQHGSIESMGLKFGDIAYSTDIKSLDSHAIERLKGIETWIVDGAGYNGENNPVHASIQEIMAMNEQIGAKHVWLTHLPPTMDYKTLIKELPEGYAPLHDGQRFLF